jgi:hypothetical protein
MSLNTITYTTFNKIVTNFSLLRCCIECSLVSNQSKKVNEQRTGTRRMDIAYLYEGRSPVAPSPRGAPFVGATLFKAPKMEVSFRN